MTTEYAVALQGQPPDLDDLRKIFTSGPIQVAEIDVASGRKVTALVSREFDDLADGMQAQEHARRLVRKINGAMFASGGETAPVFIGMTYMRTDGGAWGQGTAYASFSATVRVQSRITIENGPVSSEEQAPRQIAWLALAVDGGEPNCVAEVLRALSEQPDWFDLWKAEENIHGDQEHISNWPRDEIEWFRATATIYRHSETYRYKRRTEDKARTARERLKDMVKAEMDINAARSLVAAVAAKWLDWKVR